MARLRGKQGRSGCECRLSGRAGGAHPMPLRLPVPVTIPTLLRNLPEAGCCSKWVRTWSRRARVRAWA